MNAPAPATGTRARLAVLIHEAMDGQIGTAELLTSRATLTEAGVTSLGLLRLADALEEEFGVEVDLGDPSFYRETVDTLAARVDAADAGAPRE
ncbi:phosphopantetheine-binding protein [Streptomyces sp. NPDC060184]|uniref:acyl carrier protein n=1 Tax=Streptomyces sp. NPDC060184 TaxID=3347064 RepID=UPI0036654688